MSEIDPFLSVKEELVNKLLEALSKNKERFKVIGCFLYDTETEYKWIISEMTFQMTNPRHLDLMDFHSKIFPIWSEMKAKAEEKRLDEETKQIREIAGVLGTKVIDKPSFCAILLKHIKKYFTI
jgi:hypothetical protein